MSEENTKDTEISPTEASLLEAMTQPLPNTDYKVTAGEPLKAEEKLASKEAIIRYGTDLSGCRCFAGSGCRGGVQSERSRGGHGAIGLGAGMDL